MRLLADENFNNAILRGVWRRIPGAVFVRVQDTELAGAEDPLVLAYAAKHNYILLTHDEKTMQRYFYERIQANRVVPALFVVHKRTPVGRVVDALEIIILASDASEWAGQITFVPFD
jgi:hypothetical protein